MPTPRTGESRKSFVNRATEMMIKQEGLSPEHAYAKANGMWEQHLKNKVRMMKRRKKK